MTTPRRTERDALGIPVDDTLSPVVRQVREQAQQNQRARAAMTARRMERRLEQIRQNAVDRMQRKERARRDLEDHHRRLADELDREIARTQPNPWLKPWDTGYETPTLIALRQAAEAKPVGPVDAGAIARRMQARLAVIRQNSSSDVPVQKPAEQTAAKEKHRSFVDGLRAMTPEKVAALPPKAREMRRRWIENASRGEVRTTKGNWRLF